MPPTTPYPGTRPPFSFLHVAAQVPDAPHTVHPVREGDNLCGEGVSHPLTADPTAPSGWRLGTRCLDDVLVAAGAVPLAGRIPVLAYGSNASPSKITRMHRDGLAGPVVVLRVRTDGLSAVWAAGLRVVDDQRPATLAAAPGVVETHAVWLAAPDQFAGLDAVEGRAAGRYRLARVATGSVAMLDGAGTLDAPWAYVGPEVPPGDPRADRRPLHVDGAPVPCTALAQAGAAALTGSPGPDGLDARTVDGVPSPDAWPARVFVYGSLMPGQRAWSLLRPHASRVVPQPAFLPVGAVADTGHGYPALTLDGDPHSDRDTGTGTETGTDLGPGVPGWVVELADPVAALPDLDAYEGPEYARVRVVVEDGTVCWAWVWTAARDGHVPLPRGWAARP